MAFFDEVWRYPHGPLDSSSSPLLCYLGQKLSLWRFLELVLLFQLLLSLDLQLLLYLLLILLVQNLLFVPSLFLHKLKHYETELTF